MSLEQEEKIGRRKNRSTVRLGPHHEKRLLAYAAAASAGLLAAAVPGEAEIISTPSNTPMAIAHLNQGVAITHLDLNMDGIADFDFAMLAAKEVYSSGTTARLKYYLKIIPKQAGNETVLGAQGPTASAVPAGVTIGPKTKFAAGGLYMQLNSWNGMSTRNLGTWPAVEYAYVGLKFMINGEVHYGWARIKFPYTGGVGYPSIYGFAYESTPNEPIVTGQTSGTAQEKSSANAPASLGMLAAGASGMNIWRRPSRSDDAR